MQQQQQQQQQKQQQQQQKVVECGPSGNCLRSRLRSVYAATASYYSNYLSLFVFMSASVSDYLSVFLCLFAVSLCCLSFCPYLLRLKSRAAQRLSSCHSPVAVEGLGFRV